jgi:hypothetical protein
MLWMNHKNIKQLNEWMNSSFSTTKLGFDNFKRTLQRGVFERFFWPNRWLFSWAIIGIL